MSEDYPCFERASANVDKDFSYPSDIYFLITDLISFAFKGFIILWLGYTVLFTTVTEFTKQLPQICKSLNVYETSSTQK